MKVLIKRGVELALCRLSFARIARLLKRDGVLVLAYHNVIPDSEPSLGDRSLHITQAALYNQLKLLSKTHQFISLEKIFDSVGRKPRVAITFDDGYRGALQLGGEVLAEMNAPATVFVAPSNLGGRSFWWDVLSQEHEMDHKVRRHALSELQGKSSRILRSTNPRGVKLPEHYLSGTEADLDSALAIDGITLGSHSWSHPNLTKLTGPELREELAKSLDWLRSRFHRHAVDWLSYPYGCWSPSVAAAARETGYRGALRIDGGWLRPGSDPYAVPRLNIPAGLSIEGFQLRTSGLGGLRT